MRGVAIVSPVRTAVGNFGGTLRDVSAADLGSLVIKEVLERTGLDALKVDDVILGHGYPNGENPSMGRLASLKAGLPIEVPGYQLDRRCSSGLQAILNAAMLVQTENADVVIAGGVESMSNAEFYSNESRWGARFGSVTLHDRLARARETIAPEDRFGVIEGMIGTAENLAKQYEVSRQEQDEYSLRSHQRAVSAVESGKFASQVVPVPIPQRRGDPVIFDKDEGPRADSSLEALTRLRPIMSDGTVTAGNASSQNDAASVCMVVAEDKLEELGLTATHVGCEHGVCGICNVLVDGRAVRSCLMLAVQADGHDLTTIEGLANGDVLHPMQQAFHECHALQCGYCTPGMVMAAVSLLDEVPNPTEADVREGLEGNLCRCTGYHNIVRAVLQAAGDRS